MSAFTVFHEDEVPVELCAAKNIADGVQFFFGVAAAGNRVSQFVVEGFQLVSNLRFPCHYACLDRADLSFQIRMAFRTGILDQVFIVQRADEIMGFVYRAVFCHSIAHMTVRTGELVAVDTALAEVGLKFRMLDFDLFDSGGLV